MNSFFGLFNDFLVKFAAHREGPVFKNHARQLTRHADLYSLMKVPQKASPQFPPNHPHPTSPVNKNEMKKERYQTLRKEDLRASFFRFSCIREAITYQHRANIMLIYAVIRWICMLLATRSKFHPGSSELI